jgi:hypothetical protein
MAKIAWLMASHAFAKAYLAWESMRSIKAAAVLNMR